MRIFLVWTLFPGGWAVTGPEQVTAEQGGSLMVSCSYEPGYKLYPKYWCRSGFLWLCFSHVAQTNGSEVTVTQGRVSIRDNHVACSFMVTLGSVTPGDAGWYSCGVRTSLWFSLWHNTKVMVSTGKAGLGAKQRRGMEPVTGSQRWGQGFPRRGNAGVVKAGASSLQGPCFHETIFWGSLPVKPPFHSSSSPVPGALPGDPHLHLLHLHSQSLGADTPNTGGRTGKRAVSTTTEGSNVNLLASNPLCPTGCGEPPVLSQFGVTPLLLLLGVKVPVAVALACGAAWVRSRRRSCDRGNLQLWEVAGSTGGAPGCPPTPGPEGHPPAPEPPTQPGLC
ncbi:uncharacterized protein LOC142363902 [Opisthocomus hoazin]|uniref:uncharacterized protein LOC142363902 n=1 Tax=Opisthocomus hoazin TaxID=30419 RepID=UPI003F530796